MNKRTTIDDVARVAGVSRQTVSRAINDKHDISKTTREHVLATIDQLGYRPNRLAKGMAANQTQTIGLIIQDITNPSHADFVRGFQDAAQPSDYNIFLRNTDRNPAQEREAIQSLISEKVDGLVIVASVLESAELELMLDKFRPIILVHRECNHPNVGAIVINETRATTIALNYLMGSGHQNIGLLLSPHGRKFSPQAAEFRRIYKESGKQFNEEWFVEEETTLSGGFEATRRLLGKHPGLTALFTYNDSMAIGAMQACRMLGKNVPEDCSILGFNDIALASYSTPTLSTIRYHTNFIGHCAFDRVLEMLNNEEAVFPPLVIDTELVIRESTGMNAHKEI